MSTAYHFLCMYFCYLDCWNGLLWNEVVFLWKLSSHVLCLQSDLVLSYYLFALLQVRPKTGQFLKQKSVNRIMLSKQV